MVLAGKLSTEIGIKAPAAKFYDLFAKQLHDVQNHCERVHHTKLHEGEDWHEVGSALKHWTYVIGNSICFLTQSSYMKICVSLVVSKLYFYKRMNTSSNYQIDIC
ncbi:hypothetical protein ACUX4R_27290 [Salmonella enterica]